MSALGNLQHRLQAAVLSNEYPSGLLAGDHGEARFAIYAAAYRARLIGALRDNYPVLHMVIGDEAFDALALDYLAAHPSEHPSIRWFGDQLHAFVSTAPDRLPHPALSDLIRMEWALRGAFDAADEPPALLSELATVAAEDWPTLRFHAHASVSLLTMDWAVEPLWHQVQNQPEAEPEPPEASAHALLTWREGLETRFRTLDEPSAAFVGALIMGENFSAACEAGAAFLPEETAIPTLTNYLQQFIRDGVFTPAQTA